MINNPKMQSGLRQAFPNNFWANPDEFFTDGPLLNMGSDFALMPSLFEPSGVVQQEYYVAGTPVIAFKTGGLKDTVFEGRGKTIDNGFTFEDHSHKDFIDAISRAMSLFSDQEAYAQLRANARNSVLDMKNVAEAWAREFARLRKIMWIPESLPDPPEPATQPKPTPAPAPVVPSSSSASAPAPAAPKDQSTVVDPVKKA